MSKKDIIFILIIFLISSAFIYLILGSFGILPKWFYQQCENIDKETAMKRGCCEDRPASHPVSWIFGSDNCNRYNSTIKEKANGSDFGNTRYCRGCGGEIVREGDAITMYAGKKICKSIAKEKTK